MRLNKHIPNLEQWWYPTLKAAYIVSFNCIYMQSGKNEYFRRITFQTKVFNLINSYTSHTGTQPKIQKLHMKNLWQKEKNPVVIVGSFFCAMLSKWEKWKLERDDSHYLILEMTLHKRYFVAFWLNLNVIGPTL